MFHLLRGQYTPLTPTSLRRVGERSSLGRLKNGLYFHFNAGCDFEGFDWGGGIIFVDECLLTVLEDCNSGNCYDPTHPKKIGIFKNDLIIKKHYYSSLYVYTS